MAKVCTEIRIGNKDRDLRGLQSAAIDTLKSEGLVCKDGNYQAMAKNSPELVAAELKKIAEAGWFGRREGVKSHAEISLVQAAANIIAAKKGIKDTTAVDGIYSRKNGAESDTQKLIKSIQGALGVEADGQAGRLTLKRMAAELEATKPESPTPIAKSKFEKLSLPKECLKNPELAGDLADEIYKAGIGKKILGIGAFTNNKRVFSALHKASETGLLKSVESSYQNKYGRKMWSDLLDEVEGRGKHRRARALGGAIRFYRAGKPEQAETILARFKKYKGIVENGLPNDNFKPGKQACMDDVRAELEIRLGFDQTKSDTPRVWEQRVSILSRGEGRIDMQITPRHNEYIDKSTGNPSTDHLIPATLELSSGNYYLNYDNASARMQFTENEFKQVVDTISKAIDWEPEKPVQGPRVSNESGEPVLFQVTKDADGNKIVYRANKNDLLAGKYPAIKQPKPIP